MGCKNSTTRGVGTYHMFGMEWGKDKDFSQNIIIYVESFGCYGIKLYLCHRFEKSFINIMSQQNGLYII